ncbi:hypothetical protein BJ508DRAFT_316336, partial [Ascobolus immersus RN42]
MVSYSFSPSSTGSSTSSRSSSISTLRGIDELSMEDLTVHIRHLYISSSEEEVQGSDTASQVSGNVSSGSSSSSSAESGPVGQTPSSSSSSSSRKRRRELEDDGDYPSKAVKTTHVSARHPDNQILASLNDGAFMTDGLTTEGGLLDEGLLYEDDSIMGTVGKDIEDVPEPRLLSEKAKGKQRAIESDEEEARPAVSRAKGKGKQRAVEDKKDGTEPSNASKRDAARLWWQAESVLAGLTEGVAGPSSAAPRRRRRPILTEDELDALTRSPRATTARQGRVSMRKLTGKNKQFRRDNVPGGSKMDEKKGDVINSEILYDCLGDYPARPSTSYTGDRDCKHGGFGERSLTMMKERLCLGKLFFVKKKGAAAKGSKPFNHTDLFNQASQGLQNELLWCLGAVGCKNGRADRTRWNAALRMLVRNSTVLHEAIKAILAEGSSIMTDYNFLEPRITIEREMWTQIRRFFWHALDEVCAVFATSIRSSVSKGKASRESLEMEISHTWFRHNAAADRSTALPVVHFDNLQLDSFPFLTASLQEEPSPDSEGTPVDERVVSGYDQYVWDMEMLEWSRAQGLHHWGPGGDLDVGDGVNHEDWQWCNVEVENSPFAYEQSESDESSEQGGPEQQ